MFGSGVLDVVIGLIFLYLLLSLICSVVTEGIARILALRASDLETGIRNLLNDPEGTELAQGLYNHPLVKGLYDQGRKPSYIPSRTFTLALLDIVAPADPEAGPKEFKEVRETVGKIQNEEVKKALLVLIDDARSDFERVRANVEAWFNNAMDRVSGWYKRQAQLLILGLAAIISIALNADTLEFTRTLWNDAALRESIVAAAQTSTGQSLPDNLRAINEQITMLQLPIGWHSVPGDLLGWLAKILGLLLTTIALSLGAPFWFDLLSRFIRIRSTGKPPETSGDSA